MVGILVIGSYVYHSDVIVTTTQIYVNIIQIRIIYYSPVYCIYKLVQLSQCSSDIPVVDPGGALGARAPLDPKFEAPDYILRPKLHLLTHK